MKTILLKHILNDGYQFSYSTTTHDFYTKGNYTIVWDKAHNYFVQKMQRINGKTKVL